MNDLFKKLLRANRLVLTGPARSGQDWALDAEDSNKALRYYYNGNEELADAIAEDLLKRYEEYETKRETTKYGRKKQSK
tara:strand:+ start:115 stop:351 length:237 start_codon:yes stop_codon:yes gene_type:complete